MKKSRLTALTLAALLVPGCIKTANPADDQAAVASIVIDALQATGYDRYELEIKGLSAGSTSIPRQSFPRGNQSTAETVAAGTYKLMLDYFAGNTKIYSADYCSAAALNNQFALKPGMNIINITICTANNAPLPTGVTVNPGTTNNGAATPEPTPNQPVSPTPATQTQGNGSPGGSVVAQNGWLKVQGTLLVNEQGNPIRLKGISSHGLQWDVARFANSNAIAWMAANWNISVIRLAMYTKEGGYIDNPSVADKVTADVDAAVQSGIYVIIDWHILSDGDPNIYKQQAKSFFAGMASRYGNLPNVLYEICNEPNGGNVTWQNSIKPYADEVIPVIRQNAPRSVIIVGTGTWSQDVVDVAAAPLAFDNVMYTLHFYAGTHTQWLRDKASAALAKGVPIFVTEWGTTSATGDGGTFFDESDRWMDFLRSNNISSANWSLSDTSQSSSIFHAGANANGGWADSDLTPSGLYVKKQLQLP